MSSVFVRFHTVMGGGAPVYSPVPVASQMLASSVISVQSNAVDQSCYVSIRAIDGPVWINIGRNPTAAANTGDYLGAGDRIDYGPLSVGDRVAVVDAV